MTDELKNLMRKHMDDLVDTEEFLELLQKKYHLHECIKLVEKYPGLNNYLKEYLEIYNCVDQYNNEGMPLLCYVCIHYPYTETIGETIKILIVAGADIHNLVYGPWFNFHDFTMIQNNIKLIELLVFNGILDVNLKIKYYTSLLHWAVRAANMCSSNSILMLELINILVLTGADVFNVKDEHCETAYDYMTKKLKKNLEIDNITQTIGIKRGQMTKSAKK